MRDVIETIGGILLTVMLWLATILLIVGSLFMLCISVGVWWFGFPVVAALLVSVATATFSLGCMYIALTMLEEMIWDGYSN